MTTNTLEQKNVKFARQKPRGTKITSDDAISYQPEGCYVFPPMRLKRESELDAELKSWNDASDDDLDSFLNSISE